MPFPAIAGQRVPLNLGARFGGPNSRLVLNLGVDGGGGDPPDPPVEVVGDLAMSTRLRWRGSAVEQRRGWSALWGTGTAAVRAWHIGWGGLQAQLRRSASAWGTPPSLTRSSRVGWSHSQPGVAGAWRSPWATPPSVGYGVGSRWGRGHAGIHAGTRATWLAPPSALTGVLLRWRGAGDVRQRPLDAPWLNPPRHYRHWVLPWGYGRGLEWIVRPPRPPVDPPIDPPTDPSRIPLNPSCPVFSGPTRRLPLNLGVTECWLARPTRRTYVVLNQIEVVRLPDRLPIHAGAVSLAGSRDTWCWDARLELLDPSQLIELQPTVTGMREVEITLNGYKWVVAVETFDRDRTHVAGAVSVTGRSVSAQLADPYAPARTAETTQARSMVQLANAEASGSSVSIDYGAVDWLVPAGAWYYDGLTPMSALMRIAEASGAVVQSHPFDPVVQIRPRYPVSPWHWTTTTPDVTIQDDIVTGERLQLRSRPLFDAVICAGEHVGVSARVRRDGELGQTYAPQQIDQLLTHADGVRERGRNVLSDRGAQATVEHDLPLFAAPLQAGQPGLLLPLTLARRETPTETWHGLVTAVRIEARRQDKAVDIVQTVTLERHYSDAD